MPETRTARTWNLLIDTSSRAFVKPRERVGGTSDPSMRAGQLPASSPCGDKLLHKASPNRRVHERSAARTRHPGYRADNFRLFTPCPTLASPATHTSVKG